MLNPNAKLWVEAQLTRAELNREICGMSLKDAKAFAKRHGFNATHVVLGSLRGSAYPFFRDEETLAKLQRIGDSLPPFYDDRSDDGDSYARCILFDAASDVINDGRQVPVKAEAGQ